ncbi:MAG: protein kinase [Candidatus Obscuribacterales bacterium]|nr:protein kinase [Candidatus Obscuribacterales bacterium]
MSARSGSLTQWILRSGKCNCQKQELKIAPRRPDTTGDTACTNEELEVHAEKFPSDRYKPLAQLGTGASGTVYLARDRILSKKVAVKILNELNAEQLMQFQEEARTTSKLNHPNIIAILDFGPTDSGTPYMVLEYLDNAITLERYLEDNGPLSVEQAIKVFSDVCAGLFYAHEQGVFHRDIKPTNILLIGSEDLSAKIIDFGVAKVKQETQEPTIYQGRTIAGTPGYMAPEQVVGNTYTVQADIYSLGAVLFEALTGKQPFSGHSTLEIIAMQANSPVPSLKKTSAMVFPDPLEELVAKCLNRNPSSRFESAEELKAALEDVESMPSTLVASNSPPRRRATSGPLTVQVLIVLSLTGWIGVQLLKLFDVKPTDLKILSQDDAFGSMKLSSEHAKASEAYRVIEPPTYMNVTALDFDNDVVVKYTPDRICYVEHCGSDKGLEVIQGRKDIVDLRVRTAVDIHGDGLANLTGIPLRALSIYPSAIDDQGLKFLPVFPRLGALSLPESKIEGSTLRLLEKQRKLTFINLSNSPLTDQGLRNLNGCKQLNEIEISGCKNVTGATLSSLKVLPRLHTLGLSDTNVRPEFLCGLRSFPMLGRLKLNAVKVDQSVLQLLATSKFASLSLKNVELTDEDIARIVSCNKRLRILELGHRPSLSIRTIKKIADSQITSLTIARVPLSHEAFAALARSNNLSSLNLPSTGISYTDAYILLKKNEITTLTVSGPKLTSHDFHKLLKQFPQKNLKYEIVSVTDM